MVVILVGAIVVAAVEVAEDEFAAVAVVVPEVELVVEFYLVLVLLIYHCKIFMHTSFKNHVTTFQKVVEKWVIKWVIWPIMKRAVSKLLLWSISITSHVHVI